MDFWGPPKDDCVNRGPCYPKTEKNQNKKSRFCHIEFIICFDRRQVAATVACFSQFSFVDNHDFLV